MGSTDGFIAYALHSYNFSSMQFLWHRAVFLYVFASFFLYVDVFLQILLHRFTEAINMEGIMISFVKKRDNKVHWAFDGVPNPITPYV